MWAETIMVLKKAQAFAKGENDLTVTSPQLISYF